MSLALPTDGNPFTDSAMAERVVEDVLRDRFIWVPGLGWLTWRRNVWREVPDEVPLEAVRSWARERLKAAIAAWRDERGTKKTATAWDGWQDVRHHRNALTFARGMVLVEADKLDAHPDLLNCRNGVVHLKTGDLTPPNPLLLLTKSTGVDFDPLALHEDWTAALAAVPEAVQPWLQRRFGQAITGHMCPDDRVVIQQGGGANGKSTVLAGLSGALGDYYLLASDRILMSSQNAAHTTDLADLRGARFVAIEETPETGRLDVVRLKKLAGTERVTARKMYRDNLSYNATHTLFVNTNYPPVVGETDEGTWRRLLLVVYPYTFRAHPEGESERQGDPDLRERLSGDAQRKAALAWLVEGATAWYEAGRRFGDTPAAVESDTAVWRNATDHVAAFWADHLTPDPFAYVAASDLIWLFNNYLRTHGNSSVAESTFRRRFVEHPTTVGHLVRQERVHQERTNLRSSRPFGALDPFSRLPGVPAGRIQAWVGVSFRQASELGQWDSGQAGQEGNETF